MAVPAAGYVLGGVVLVIGAAFLAGVHERYLAREARLHAGAAGEAAHAGMLQRVALATFVATVATLAGVLLTLT